MDLDKIGKIKSAAVAEDQSGRQYHIRVAPGEISRYVLLPGDPARTDIISSIWDSRRLIAYHREYKSYTGMYKDTRISTVSTGIGAPSTLIAVEELLRVGSDTFIRVGTMGAIQASIKPGDLVIGLGAVRYEGASKDYIDVEYPALANYEVIISLIEAAESLGVRYHVGIVASTDTFYLGQSRPGYKGYVYKETMDRLAKLAEAGVLGFEMEASALFTVSSLYGARAGCVCTAIANRVTNEFIPDKGVEEAARVASEAVVFLSKIDEKKKEAGKKWYYPSLFHGI